MSPDLQSFNYFPDWSPDGKRVLFNGSLPSSDTFDPSGTDVFHVNATDGSDLVRVTRTAGFDGRCFWGAAPRATPVPPVTYSIPRRTTGLRQTRRLGRWRDVPAARTRSRWVPVTTFATARREVI